MLLIASALALSLATVKIPDGVLELPAGCSGPASITVLIDTYMGFISCNQNKTNILVEGSAISPSVCPKDAAQFKSRHGASLIACLWERTDGGSKKRVQTMIIDIGFGSLRVDVKEPRDAFLLLQIASSFRPDRKQAMLSNNGLQLTRSARCASRLPTGGSR
jgi:hypothetical protein